MGAHGFSLQAFVCFPVVPSAVSSLGQLGPKLIPVLCLDGFPLLLIWFLIFPGPAKLTVLFFTLQSGLGVSLPEVPVFPVSGFSSTPLTLIYLFGGKDGKGLDVSAATHQTPLSLFQADLSPTGMCPGSSTL